MSEQRTCGEYYREALQKYGSTDAAAWAFAAGFVHGQAEKVMIGACRAAMFRPSAEKREGLLDIVDDACKRYELVWREIGFEIWICKPNTTPAVLDFTFEKENSPRWHAIRADLCGVSLSIFDPAFHERQGYNQVCDQRSD